MNLGKLDNDTLDRLILRKFKKIRTESFGTPRIGMDCAMLDFGSDLIVLSCDPITSADWKQLGYLSVHVNCNDAAAGGAEPVGLLVTLLLPPNATYEMIDQIADDLQSAASDANVDILGGHTEVTDCVTRAVTNTTVVARVPRGAAPKGACVGDAIVMTKWAGIEGTMLIASDRADLLDGLPDEVIEHAKSLRACLSVVPESRIAIRNGAHAMHDVTEGGVLGAVWELAEQNGYGAEIDPDSIPILPETKQITEAVGIDPYRLMSSGSMLIACPDGAAMCDALLSSGIHAVMIGKITESGVRYSDGTAIDPPEADALYALF